MNAVVES